MSDYEISSSESESSEINETGKREHQESGNKQANKKRKKELLKPPTTEELNRLRETENLYNSNLIRLQIEEVLSEISIKQKYLNQIDQWWNNFLKVINSIKSEKDILLSEIKPQNGKKLSESQKLVNELFEKKTSIKYDRDCTLKLLCPESCTLFGEYQLQCLIKTDIQLNINIKMPSETFSVKDYLNNRYFIKRHYYLLFILYSIKEKVSSSKMEVLFYENFNFLPFIQITPEFSNKVKINLCVTGSEKFFNLSRFLPDKNNIKFSFDDNFNDIDVKTFGEIGTPSYNSFIAKDLTLLMNYEYMKSLLNVKNIQDGIKLLMLWLAQREINRGFGNFSNEMILFTITYLVKEKKINSHMSSYQVVRIFWSFLINSNWKDEPISLCDDVKSNIIDMYKKNYDIVFLDLSGFYNITSFLHLNVYLKLKQEAQLALNILDGNKFNSFTSLFLMKVPFHLQYDAIIKLKDENNFKTIYEAIAPEKKWKYYGFINNLIINEITDILRRGFTKRVSTLVPYSCNNHTLFGNIDMPNVIIFGINLNPEFAFNVIEKGLSEDNPQAVKDFQAFWKGLTSFRRFQDSTAAEVVYFQCRTLQDKRNIFLKILEFLFTKKYPLNMKVISNQFEKVLKLEKTIIHFPTGTNEEACLKVKHIYTDLSKKLRDLQLPLIISNIQGASDVFSYTEVFPPIPTTYKEDEEVTLHSGNNLTLKLDIKSLPMLVSPIECVLQMGKSSAWSDDIEVLRCMKCEFYIRLSELLESEHAIISSVTLDHLDIFYEGLVFRFRLFVPKELMLLKKTLNSDNVIAYKDNEESLKLEVNMEILPKITSALSGVHQIYPSFGPCCALIKRWLRSQMIDNFHISDTVINLWNASIYLNDPPFETAILPQVAFLRFLRYLMDFDWKLNPIIVNFNSDIDSSTLSDMEAKFQQNRNSYPNLYIITPYDQGRSVFSKQHPSKYVLKRICLLARETYKFVNSFIMKWDDIPVKDIFMPNLQGYDVVIHLEPSYNPLTHQNISIDSNSEKNYIERYDKTVSNKMPVIDFNPVNKYLMELREIYGEYALFFHDSYGGSIIGMLWNTHVLDPKEFKVSHVNGKKLIDGKLIVNHDAILEDIYNRGSGIIKNIEKNVIV